MLNVQHLTVSYGPRKIVNDISFTVSPGQWLMLVGPNGAGKSTIVNAISQGVSYQGTIHFDGKDLARCRAGERARSIGILSQNHTVGYSFTVEEVVRLGRYAYSQGIFSPPPAEDKDMVHTALEVTGLLPLAGQSVMTLSGGELQRTFLAQLFAQDPQLLILDEPTNHLDLVYQKQVFALIRHWIERTGRSVISVVHDLSLAKAYGTHAILLNQGREVAQGTVSEVFTRQRLLEVYGLDVFAWMGKMLGQWTDDTMGNNIDGKDIDGKDIDGKDIGGKDIDGKDIDGTDIDRKDIEL